MTYFCSIASGSSGNCALYVRGHARILIDAGTNAKHISSALKALGLSAEDLTHILITHTHSDHISALPVLLKHTGAALICSDEAYEDLSAAAPYDNTQVFEAGECLSLCDVPVRTFRTPHDSLGSCGYVLGEDSWGVSFCTDLGRMTPDILDAISGTDTVYLESNHDLDMLRKGPYPAFLKQRIASDLGHLSNAACAKTVETLVERGARRVVLAHLSEKNNTPRHAQAENMLALYRMGADQEVELTVAPRRELMEPVLL